MNTVSRSRLALLAAVVLAGGLQMVALPHAEAIPLPVFENLESKWSTLTVGMTMEEVIQRIGSAPRQHEQSELVGVRVDDMSWIDIQLNQYRARFLAGRLYAKNVSRGG